MLRKGSMKTKRGKVTVTEAARLMKVSRRAVSAWIASGKVRAEREGRAVLVNMADLDALKADACPICGKQVARVGTRQAYCSPACRQKAYRERVAGRERPAPNPARLRVAFRRVLKATH